MISSLSRSLNHFGNHFLCPAALCSERPNVQQLKNTQMCREEHHRPLLRLSLFEFPLILYSSVEHSSALPRRLLHTMLDYSCLHCAAPQGEGKIKCRSPPVPSPASLLSHHCPVVYLNPSLPVTFKAFMELHELVLCVCIAVKMLKMKIQNINYILL